MTPEGLDDVLGNWDEAARGGMKRPRVLYTVPVAQNPTGATMTTERKKQIYALAVKYDIIIVEDDRESLSVLPLRFARMLMYLRNSAYYFLQCGEYEAPSSRFRASKTETDEEFLKSLIPSYLKFDYQGRVIRIDTFSSTSTFPFTFSSQCTDLVERLSHLQRPSLLALVLAGSLSTLSSRNACSVPTRALHRRLQASLKRSWPSCWSRSGDSRVTFDGSRVRDASSNSHASSSRFLISPWSSLPDTIHLSGIKAQYRDRRDRLVDLLVALGNAGLDARTSADGTVELRTRDKRGRDEKGFLSEKDGKDSGKTLLSFVAPQGGMFGTSTGSRSHS